MDTINTIVSKNIKEIRKEKDLSLDELARLRGVSAAAAIRRCPPFGKSPTG